MLLTSKEYINLCVKQNNVCAICENKCPTGYNLAIDHNHITGEIRGLLCINCNGGLGNFKDSIKLLDKAIIYLKEKYIGI